MGIKHVTNKDRLREHSEPQPYPLVEQARGEAEYLFIANNETGKDVLRGSRKNRGRAKTSPGRRLKNHCISA